MTWNTGDQRHCVLEDGMATVDFVAKLVPIFEYFIILYFYLTSE